MATRREFAKLVAVTAFGSAAGVPSVDAAPRAAPRANALADALTEVVKAQSGNHLTSADVARIRNDFREYTPYLESLRAVPLSNADEPDVTFQALAKRWP